MTVLSASEIGKIYNGQPLFQGASFKIEKGDKIGLVGANGAGKTTLMRIIMGEIASDMGELFQSRETSIAYMEQHALSDSRKTVYDEVLEVFAPVMAMEEELTRIQQAIDRKEGDLDALVRRQFALNEQYEAGRGFVYRSLVRSTLLGLGFSEEELGQSVHSLSGGQKTRVLLARILLSGSNLLLLDEPTNHLDIDAVTWLEDFLRGYEGAVLVVSHDRYFLDRVTQTTYEMECGRLTVYPGNYSRYLVLKEEAMKSRLRAYQNTMAEIERLERSAEKLRSFNREKTVKRAESKDKQIERLSQSLEVVETEDRDLHLHFTPRVTGGNEVVRGEGLAKAFGGKTLFAGGDLYVQRQERVFILGPNGCGKTTLLRMVLGQLEPDAGEVWLGASVEPAYYEQTGATLHSGKTVLDEVWDEYPQMNQTQVRSALAAFLFKGEEVFKEISMLSGGERARVALLKIMLQRGNLLVLDEPTNHLDIQSREALEAALAQYEGTILCVSHDRYFINKLATRIYDITPEGFVSCPGDYDAYAARRQQETRQEEERKAPSDNALDYRARKELESRRRKAATALRRCEEEIARTEEEIEKKNQLLCTDEVSGDYQKAMEVTAQVRELEARLEELMEQWEACSLQVEELEEL
ncbi:MAG: ribosomal protection-like ABC-F family protein [Eubacteriales bacterium]|jgi:ATP-binding cassette subfamily F protein 3